jgi:hypothetical protein
MSDTRMDYIARKKCGCVVGICIDHADKDTARRVADWIKDGLTIDRVPVKEAVALFTTPCTHETRQLTLDGAP